VYRISNASSTVLLCLLLVLSSGCAILEHYTSYAVTQGPGGAPVGLLGNDTTYPNEIGNPTTRMQFYATDLQSVVPVQAEAESTSILFGLFGFGDSGYGKLTAAAREVKADAVMDVTVDTRVLNVLWIYRRVTMYLMANAIKYKIGDASVRPPRQG